MNSLRLRCALILAAVVSASAPAFAATPAYMTADRAVVEKKFGAVITGNIFSDRLTGSRKKIVTDTLRKNPAPGCASNPSFAVVAVVPLFANDKDGTAWEERFEIACSPAVYRSALFTVSRTAGWRVTESVPGASLASIALRKEFMPKLLESAATPGCAARKISVVDAAPVSRPEAEGAAWTEVWKLKACGAEKEIEVAFTPGEAGAATTWQFTPKAPPEAPTQTGTVGN